MENTNTSNRIGIEPIKSLLLEFSIPAIIGMLVNALYNIVDRIFIGYGVGQLAIGGVFVGLPLGTIILAFGMLVGVGGNTLVSIRLGQHKKDAAQKILIHSFVLLTVIGIILTLIGFIFIEPLLIGFGATEANLPYAIDYMKIILIGVVPQIIGFGMNNFIRGEGNPKIAMFTMLIGAFINTILDPIFIFVFNMGVQGAALATIISQTVSAIWVVMYFTGGKSLLKLTLKNFKTSLTTAIEIFSYGFSPFSMQLAASLVMVILNKRLNSFGGDIALSSMSVIQSISMMILMPVFGINQGVQPILGYNYGAKKYDRVKEALKYAIIWASAITVFGFLFIELFPNFIFKIFLNKPEELAMVTKIGVPGLRIYLCAIGIVGFQVIGSNYFQATGQPKYAMLLSMSRQVLILIPMLLILPNVFGLLGIWMAAPISDSLSTLLTAFLLKRDLKKLDKQIAEQ